MVTAAPVTPADPRRISDEAWAGMPEDELGADGRYVVVLGAGGGRVEPVPGFDGLVLDLDQLWGELDGLSAEEPEDEG
jgi:hypothetical protein